MVKSMTGYGRCVETVNGREFTVELRSVNNRYLDCNVKLPRMLSFAEEAVKQAVNSPLLETSIEGAANILINTSGKVNIVSLNEALDYVRELAGSKVNIIWGTVTQENYDPDKIVVTLIATGMSSEPAEEKKSPFVLPAPQGLDNKVQKFKQPMPRNEIGIDIPTFILEASKRSKRK